MKNNQLPISYMLDGANLTLHAFVEVNDPKLHISGITIRLILNGLSSVFKQKKINLNLALINSLMS